MVKIIICGLIATLDTENMVWSVAMPVVEERPDEVSPLWVKTMNDNRLWWQNYLNDRIDCRSGGYHPGGWVPKHIKWLQENDSIEILQWDEEPSEVTGLDENGNQVIY